VKEGSFTNDNGFFDRLLISVRKVASCTRVARASVDIDYMKTEKIERENELHWTEIKCIISFVSPDLNISEASAGETKRELARAKSPIRTSRKSLRMKR